MVFDFLKMSMFILTRHHFAINDFVNFLDKLSFPVTSLSAISLGSNVLSPISYLRSLIFGIQRCGYEVSHSNSSPGIGGTSGAWSNKRHPKPFALLALDSR